LKDEGKAEFEANEDDRKEVKPWIIPSLCCEGLIKYRMNWHKNLLVIWL
jgi:hypothetical protein